MHVTMREYQHPREARKFYAPDVAPSLDLSVPILQISGLDNYMTRRPKYHKVPLEQASSAMPRSGSGSSGAYIGQDFSNAYVPFATNSGPSGSYIGQDFRNAYLPGVTNLTGTGQMVGLLQFDAYYTNDIKTYITTAGISTSVVLTNVAVGGGVSTPADGQGEVTLDIEMVISMAPGVSKIFVFEAPNDNSVSWSTLLQAMANYSFINQFSCSWGDNYPGTPDYASEGIFLSMAAAGQSFYNASDDSDAFSSKGIPFPSESTNITQVGGTTLSTGTGGTYTSEKVWNWGNGTGSSGGVSTNFPLPYYQTNIANWTANKGSSSHRNVPDVALTADNVYNVFSNGVTEVDGGTSCAAPLWAGFTALVNQQAAANGMNSVGFVNPAIYAIGAGTNYSACFHDTTTGNNGTSSKYPAVTGYDLCTGWGTPTGTNLINALAGPAGAPDLTITKSHTGNFLQGDTGDTYTIIVNNIGGIVSTGTVSVVDTLPAGLTATAISGTGWTPNLGTLTCTRSDALAAGSAYPAITLTVNVAANAPASVTNSVTVSGGGDTNLVNNTANDPTTIIVPSAPTATTGTATGIGTTTATLNGTVNPNGLSTWAQFPYGLTTSYGSTNVVSGPLTGASAQAVSASLTGLTAGTTYHFYVSATNTLGAANGSDQTFTTTALVPDLAITKSHSGNFKQGDAADIYTIIVTNVGNAASSGTVTVTDTLPTGLTATAINGTGWTTDIPTLTATRSDALAAGASYPAITVTVSVSASAPGSVTNVATVSGGGESVTSNDTASDLTTITSTNVSYSGILAGWDVSGQSSYGASPMTASTNAPNLTVGGLTRGSGVTTSGTAASRAWGGNGFTSTSESAAFTAGDFATFSISANTGYKVSLTNISRLDYRRSSSGPPSGALRYQVGSGAFVDITALSYSSTASGGASLGPIDLSGITALQNVSAGTTVTFQIVNWGASSSGGNWYIYDVATSAADDLEVQGTISSVSSSSAPDLTLSKSHTGNFTQGDTGDTYTIIVTNIGTAASSGTVTVTDTLPAGLTATGITGTGWTPNLGTLTCTRSDALTVGATYPPITVTVSVATNAASSVVNTATVSGGGDTSSGNNTVNDSTTINAASAPTATTSTATSVGTTTATLNGTVNPNGQPATVQFQYGLTTAYGSIATVAGPLTGSTGQAVSANLTGLTPGATYHFLVNATNVIGSANGSDLTFTTAAPDLAITKTHVGNFTQGDAGDTYTITVTNIGNAASSGTVTVTDTLPAGLTATAISGMGWTTNLSTLTCTRSDSLAVGAGYPPITVTVTVATNAAASVTNTATVSGGGDTSSGNNTASDSTTINVASAPTTTTSAATSVGMTTATLNGTVNPDGQPTTVQFQYGLTTAYGSIVAVAGQLAGNTGQAVSANLTGLLPGTTYHFLVSATNVIGSGTGSDLVFTTTAPDLTITKTHAGNFTQGDTGDTYTITITNIGAADSLWHGQCHRRASGRTDSHGHQRHGLDHEPEHVDLHAIGQSDRRRGLSSYHGHGNRGYERSHQYYEHCHGFRGW